MPSARFTLLDITLRLESNDEDFVNEFDSVFGGRASDAVSGLPPATLHAILTSQGDEAELRVWGDGLADPAGFLMGFSSATIPLRATDSADPEWHVVVVDNDERMRFAFRDDVCRFPRIGRWRRILSHFLFLRMLAMRREAMFFHAASVGIRERGVLIIGPKGSGKSTLSLGLASRGHAFLGDETAAYVAANRTLIPFRRPAGIKPGPKASLVEQSLDRVQASPDEDGMLRVDASRLFDLGVPAALPLCAVVFLKGFAGTPAMERVQPGRDELALMQPIASTLSNAPASARVFQMIRLLASVDCFVMQPGPPDSSVELIERTLG
jgi:hypothetical protein